MIDGFSAQLTILLVEAFLCLALTPIYAISKDPIRIRKSVVVSLNLTCSAMLFCEYLFYVYNGSSDSFDVFIMHLVNAGVYYLIVLMMLFYAMLVFLRLFGRFDVRKDMPCRKRLIAVITIFITGVLLISFSQFTGIYYTFDSNNVYQRGPLFWLAAIIPTAGALIVSSVLIEHREKISLTQRLIMLSYLVLPIAGEVIQFLFFGNSLMNISLGLAVLLMSFENVVDKEKAIIKATKTEVRTGLANEHGVIEWLNNMKGKEELKKYSAVFFDLRKFSDINRIYGVSNDNRILANFGDLMLSKIDSDEILGRQFGNQFVAIVRKEHLNNLLETLKGVDVPFTDIDSDKEIIVTLSARAGVYNIDRTDLDGEDILVFAGQALSAAKSKENDDVVWLTQDLIDEIAARKKLESDIDRGLKTGEFKVEP